MRTKTREKTSTFFVSINIFGGNVGLGDDDDHIVILIHSLSLNGGCFYISVGKAFHKNETVVGLSIQMYTYCSSKCRCDELWFIAVVGMYKMYMVRCFSFSRLFLIFAFQITEYSLYIHIVWCTFIFNPFCSVSISLVWLLFCY